MALLRANQEIPLEVRIIKGSNTILLVDGEELMIDVGQTMLQRLGYRVMVCRSGQEAVNVITDIGNIIDTVILDLIMPGAARRSTALTRSIPGCRFYSPADMLSMDMRTKSCAEGATGSFKNHIIFLNFHKKSEKCWMNQKTRLNRSYPKVEYLYENRYKPLIVSILSLLLSELPRKKRIAAISTILIMQK